MYTLYFTPSAKADLAALDKSIGQRILDKLKWYAQHGGEVPLPALKGGLSGLHKLRVGDWRAILDVDTENKKITVHGIGHRKDVYKLP